MTQMIELPETKKPAERQPGGGSLATSVNSQFHKPGIYRKLDAAIYHALDGASNSRLLKLARSPAHAWEAINDPEDPTEAMILGDAFHLLTLEGDDAFARHYVVAGQCIAVTEKKSQCKHPGKWNVGGEWFCGTHIKKDRHGRSAAAMHESAIANDFAIRHVSESSVYFIHEDGRQIRVSDHEPNAKTLAWMIRENVESVRIDLPPYGSDDARRVLSQKDRDQCMAMRDAVMDHKGARELLDARTDTELSLLWDDPAAKVRCKARIDLLTEPGGVKIVTDLKSCRDASPKEFARTAFVRGYHQQGRHYIRGLAANRLAYDEFRLIAVEKGKKPKAAVYRLSDHDLMLGLRQLEDLLARYGECEATGYWPGYPDECQELSLPKWAARELEDYNEAN